MQNILESSSTQFLRDILTNVGKEGDWKSNVFIFPSEMLKNILLDDLGIGKRRNLIP